MLSVCIVHYHGEEDLERFLNSLETYPLPVEYEVIVVDNGSKSGFVDRMKERFGAAIHWIKPGRNLGFGAAMNLAAKQAKGEYLFLANPDLLVPEGSFSQLFEFAQASRDFGVIGPRLVDTTGNRQFSCRRFPRWRDLFFHRLSSWPFFKKRSARYVMADVDLKTPLRVDWLVGAALLLRRDRFLELGGFDERFFLFFEDTDLCRRAKEAGYEVWYDPDAVLLHSHERLSERGLWPFRKVFWIHLASAVKYFWKYRIKK